MAHPRSSWRASLAALTLLVAGVLVVYAPVRAFDFVYYDDPAYVIDNPHVARGLDAREIAWVFTHHYAANYHPLTWLSHMLDVQAFGEDAAGAMHVVNVFLHALNACLVWALARRLGLSTGPALAAAGLFALHPLRVESVAWISERKDVLCASFFLTALLAYLAHRRAPSRPRFALVAVLTLLALLAKPMAVTLPGVLLLLDVALGRWRAWQPRGGGLAPDTASPSLPSSGAAEAAPPSPAPTRPGKTDGARSGFALVAEKWPLLLVVALACVLTFIAQRVGGATGDLDGIPFGLRVLNAARSAGVYLLESVVPSGLAPFYPHAALVERDDPLAALWPSALGATVVLIALAIATWRLRGQVPLLPIGLAWTLGTLVPVIGLVQVGQQSHADRYTYLPLIGIVLGLAQAGQRLAEVRPSWRRPLAAAGLAACLALAASARAQVAHWKDTRTLFTHTLAVTERNATAHLTLGAYLATENPAEAEQHLRAAIEINPLDALAFANLGRLYLDRGDLDAAARALARARKLNPSKWARYYSGRLAMMQQDLPAAEREFTAALALDPSLVDACVNLGQVLFALGRKDEARQRFLHGERLAPDLASVHNGLGAVALEDGALEEAVRRFRRATELDPQYADAWNNLSLALRNTGDETGAAAAAAEARRLRSAR
jgi:tetratricopeptide (TPR) repeat protein